jgi:hypothetical protein
MTSMNFSLLSFVWLAFGLLVGALHILAAVLLLRDRGPGPWMMLAGGVISLCGSVASQAYNIFRIGSWYPSGDPELHMRVISALSGFSALGSLLFCVGLVLFALNRRALARRVEELESILRSRPVA